MNKKRIAISVLNESGELEKTVPLDTIWSVELNEEIMDSDIDVKSEMVSVILQETKFSITPELIIELLFKRD